MERAFADSKPYRFDLAFLEELFGLGEVALRVLHELAHGFLAAETIGLALQLRADRAVSVDLLARGETHGAHIVVLAGEGGCRKQYGTGKGCG